MFKQYTINYNNHPGIVKNLPNLEDIYVKELFIHSINSTGALPLSINSNPNATLHFTNIHTGAMIDEWKRLIFEYKRTLGFKTFVFEN